MKTEFFIASRISSKRENKNKISYKVLRIAINAIVLSMAVMILSLAIVTGFKNEIRKKVIGFDSHIVIKKHDTNTSYETAPVNRNQDFYFNLPSIKGINHIQVFATKAGIIKTKTDIQGIVLKGVGSDYDWSFFKDKITQGDIFEVKDGEFNDTGIISEKLADMLNIKLNDQVYVYFIQKPPRLRKFIIRGIYSTSLEELDKRFMLIDIAHIQKLNGWTEQQVSGFEVQIDDDSELEQMTDSVFSKVALRYNKELNSLQVTNIQQLYPQIFDWLELTNMNVTVILTIILIVAGINMISGLLIIILEHTRMIGVLKALGASNWMIQKIFLYNAGFLVSRGLFWGNIFGITIALIQKYFKLIQLDPASYYVDSVPINIMLSHLVMLNVGTLAFILVILIIPSFLITRIRPIQAIRFD